MSDFSERMAQAEEIARGARPDCDSCDELQREVNSYEAEIAEVHRWLDVLGAPQAIEGASVNVTICRRFNDFLIDQARENAR